MPCCMPHMWYMPVTCLAACLTCDTWLPYVLHVLHACRMPYMWYKSATCLTCDTSLPHALHVINACHVPYMSYMPVACLTCDICKIYISFIPSVVSYIKRISSHGQKCVLLIAVWLLTRFKKRNATCSWPERGSLSCLQEHACGKTWHTECTPAESRSLWC